jgi:EmrB/QacA subfamily drug resistance transporter
MRTLLDTVRELRATSPRSANPWHSLWAMMVGFFMILVDATIVSVANPSIMDGLRADYDAVIWVTSAYLLAYAVPLLLAGRLGDRFGPKNLYLSGLALFTLASLWCGLAGSIEMLIAARVVQGVGAALLTPQTLSAITRLFPADRRGVALSIWGATAGVATLVGPLAGGVLVDGLGWHWIFIVNVPVGVVGLVLAYWFVPELPTERHGFDLLGVFLSGVGMLLIVFALQEGQSHDWSAGIWATIAAGLALLAGFVYWQSVNTGEPLIPLRMFRDNDFSLSNVGIAVIAFAVTAMIVPVMFYAQAVCGLSPTRAALLTAPMAIASGVLAPIVGKLVDRVPPRPIVGFGFSALAIALTWLSFEMTTTTPIWRLVLPLTLMGIGMAFVWSPLAATATRHLPVTLAGAGSGVYNTTRQVGGVLGSAGIAAFMTSRISAEMPNGGARPDPDASITALPEFLQAPFAEALSQTLLLPAFVALFGIIAALFLRGAEERPAAAVDRGDELRRLTATPHSSQRAEHHLPDEYYPDDDEYVEYLVDWEESGWDEPGWEQAGRDESARVAMPGPMVVPQPMAVRQPMAVPRPMAVPGPPADDSVTEPLGIHVDHPLPAPADTWHGGPVETWQHLTDDEDPGAPVPDAPAPVADVLAPVAQTTHTAHNGREPWRSILDDLLGDAAPTDSAPPHAIGLPHNGFHVEHEERSQVPLPPPPEPPSRGGGRHSRTEDDDAGTYGRHSMRFRD